MRGWILAGGQARRFGSDKACFLVDGVPLALRLAGVLRAAGLDPWLVARAPRALGLPELIEPDAPHHPLHGVAVALAASAAAGDELAFFTPCDLVDLDVSAVRRLLDPPALAAGHPLLGVMETRRAADAAAAAAAGEGVFRFQRGLPTVEVRPLTNLNRPPAGAGSAR